MKLSDCTNGKNNNLNLIRFIAAILVVFCHAFPLVLGGDHRDYLNTVSKGQIDFGGLAVSVFFFYGGFLISKSMFRLKTAKAFFHARCARIFPPLIFVTFVLTFIVGPILTEYSFVDYFQSIATYKYLLNCFFVLVHSLPGVFENNIYADTVNGPLWTLPIEFLCYIACYIAYRLQLLNRNRFKWTIVPTIALYCAGCFVIPQSSLLYAVLRPVLFFYIGMFCFVYQESISMKRGVFLLCTVGLLISILFGGMFVFFLLLFPYFLLWVGFATKIKFPQFGSKYELSYGMYLCGWPIQQTLVSCSFAWMTPIVNFLISITISLLCAWMICLLVERPIQKWVRK